MFCWWHFKTALNSNLCSKFDCWRKIHESICVTSRRHCINEMWCSCWRGNGVVAATFCGNSFPNINFIVFSQKFNAKVNYIIGLRRSRTAIVRRKCTSLSAQLEWMHASCGARQHVRLDRAVFVVHSALNLNAKTRIYTFAMCAHSCRIRCRICMQTCPKPNLRHETKQNLFPFAVWISFKFTIKISRNWQREGVRELVRYCIGLFCAPVERAWLMHHSECPVR